MKKSYLSALLMAFVATTASASVYQCNSRDFGKATITVSTSQKAIQVVNENYSSDPVVGKLDPKFKARNDKWVGCKKYDFGNMPFGEDGSTSFLISKEMLAGAPQAFAQYRNTWDSYTSYTMPCTRVK